MSELQSTNSVSITKAISPSVGMDSANVTPIDGYGEGITGEARQPVTRAGRSSPRDRQERRGTTGRVPPETRAAFRTYWKKAIEAARGMVLAAREEEFSDLLVAAHNLEGFLGRLWELRSAREIDWRTILNHAQGVMHQFFEEHRVELLRPEQCESLLELVERFLGPSTKTVEDLTEVVRLIEDAHFDPFAGISGEPTEEAES